MGVLNLQKGREMIAMVPHKPKFLENQVVVVRNCHKQYLRQVVKVDVIVPMWMLVLKATPGGIAVFSAIGLYVWVYSHL